LTSFILVFKTTNASATFTGRVGPRIVGELLGSLQITTTPVVPSGCVAPCSATAIPPLASAMNIPISVTESEAVLTLTSIALTLTTVAESSIVVAEATIIVVESSVVVVVETSVVVVEASVVIIPITTASTVGNIASKVEQVAQTKESVVDISLGRCLPLPPPIASATSS